MFTPNLSPFQKGILFTLFGLLPLIAFSPLFNPPPGLQTPEPISAYLNGSFPTLGPPEAVETVEAFPNITFDSPLTFTMHPQQNRIFVGQRNGEIYHFENRRSIESKTLFLDLSPQVGVVWDGGFLGMAFHPNFGQAGQPGRNYFYVYYNTRDGNGGNEPTSPRAQPCIEGAVWNGGYNILSRFEVIDGTLTVRANSETILFRTRHYNSTHYGGGLLFGLDGFLYLTTGDQAQHNPAQNINNNLDGGVLRIDVDKNPSRSHAPIRRLPQDSRGPDEISGVEYWIPNDNPFLGGGRMEEYYSMGHRNPHRMTMDAQTGKLYIGEIGSSIHEEINVVKKGGNFGWPVFEGFNRNNTCVNSLYQNMEHEGPLTSFPRSEANSIIGGYVYRGSAVPCMFGKYVCADYGNGEELFTVDINTGDYTKIGAFLPGNVISFGEDHDKELYVLGQGNNVKIHKFRLAGNVPAPPTRLSQTGAFTNLATLETAPGLIPYDLIEPFWSDGAIKKRWMAIPNDGTHNTNAEQIQYSENGEWEFPIGSVLVKHFELPLGNDQTRRLETRFSIKGQDGQFYFLTYKWRADGSDADLLTASTDETYTAQLPNGTTQSVTWHFPNQGECMTCHNEAVNGTLGPRTRQLNKNYLYEETGILANQLVTLSSLGILNQTITDQDTPNLLTSVAKDDANAGLEQRARSYLDVNCGYCHRPGTGNRGIFDARLSTSLSSSNLFSNNINQRVGPANSAIVTPQNTALAELYIRAHSLELGVAMPPLAKGIRDEAGVQLIADWINSMDPASNQNCSPAGSITQEIWTGLPRSLEVNSVPFNTTPNSTTEINQFEIAINTMEDYGTRLRGYIYPAQTGNYRFWISSDDKGEFWISNSTNPSGKQLVAQVPEWTASREWTKYPEQQSTAIFLEQGKAYYVEALMREGGGGDNLAIGWTLPNGTLQRPIPGSFLSPISATPCTNTSGNCSDNDGDGVCSTEDCNDNNPSISMVGDRCNDGDNRTSNDRIQNNCICAGAILTCTDTDGDGICLPDDCDDNNPAISQAGDACNDGNANTENDRIQNDCSCAGTPIIACTDTDGDGICLPDDCDDNNPAISQVGDACNDGNANTENDRIQNDCSCTGTPIITCTDTDGDGICLSDDCDDNNPAISQAGDACNDGNANTENDRIQNDCSCTGTPIDTGGGTTSQTTCGEITITYGNGTITVTGQQGQRYFVKIDNITIWTSVLNCTNNCGASQSISNLPANKYLIRVFNDRWAQICNEEIELSPSTGGGNPCTDNDNDGICQADDCDDNNATIGRRQTIGTACNDNNSSTENDRIQSDGCTCEGTPIDTGGGTNGSNNTGSQTVDCGEVTISYGSGEMNITGQSGSNYYYYKIARISPSWAVALNCIDSSCGSAQSLSGLANGTYSIRIFSSNWQLICAEIQVEMTGGSFVSSNSRSNATNKEAQAAFYNTPLPVRLFPNPAKYLITLDLSNYINKEVEIELIGIEGSVLQHIQLPSDHASAYYQLDVSQITNGLYQVRVGVKDVNGVIMLPVVIAR